MAIKESDRIEITCPNCQMRFQKGSYQQVYCSPECGWTYRNKENRVTKINLGQCFRCGSSLIGKRMNANYCSRSCKSMEHTSKKRSKTQIGTPRRFLIYKRDSGVCYICNLPVKFEDYDADHLVPISRGGEHSNSNLATTHSLCNKRRGTRMGIEQLMKIQELRSQ